MGISGDFWEELETLAALRRPVEIIFRADNGGRSVLRDSIVDIFEEAGKQWITTGNGLHIALDQLLEVNGRIPSKNS